jgi:hypothetical protein
MFWVIANALDNAQTFRPSFPEKESIPNSEILWSLDKAERDYCSVPSSDVRSVDVDYGAGLGDWTDVQHCLVFCFDGSCVREDQN